ncbi:dihydropyrimidinase-like, partial [Centruroides sculpturatus]|uniref:dihydropyrimidinase-like n=1 Tax=Centruroides sculpturatus TaxID=218467 RepID=UPI000C6DB285
KLLISNGIITNDDASSEGDIYIENGIIEKIGKNLKVSSDTRIIDANGNYVIPGGIDPHTHFQFPFMGSVTIDDFYSGTRAALAGGTTMIMDFVAEKDASLLDSYKKWRGWADDKVCCDYGLHVAVASWSDQVAKEMEILTKEKGIL